VTERIKTVLAVYLLLADDDRLLFLRRQNSGWQDGRYTVPAGHVDEGESAKAAIVREAREEIGVQLEADDLQVAHVMHRKDQDPYVDIYFRCRNWTGTPQVMEPHKADDMLWAPIGSLPVEMVPTVQLALELIRAGSTYSEDSW
jgi:8-oxo-dGTP diphosphatase